MVQQNNHNILDHIGDGEDDAEEEQSVSSNVGHFDLPLATLGKHKWIQTIFVGFSTANLAKQDT
jgi:hypothetical protein